jgi:predicted transcriptional regulator
MNFGTSSSFQAESEILLYTLGLLSCLVLVNIGVVIKKNEIKARKQKENFENNFTYSIYEINKQERIVLDHIQEYLKDNKQLELDKVINQLNSRFTKSGIDLNIIGIKESIRSLIDKKFIVEGSKLTREDVLENQNRTRIFEFIKEKPGAHLMKIVRALNISNFLARWHLDMLLKFNYIKSEKINNHEIYYDLTISPKEARRNHLIMNEKCLKILRFLKSNNKGMTKYQLAKNLGMHYNTITKYIMELDEYDLVYKKDCKNRIHYFLNC